MNIRIVSHPLKECASNEARNNMTHLNGAWELLIGASLSRVADTLHTITKAT